MSDAKPPVASRRIPQTTEPEVGMQFRLNITDPEVVAEISRRPEAEQEQFVMTALRVGVIALKHAGGFVDAETLKNQGQLILKDLEGKLLSHTNELDRRLADELKRYFNPDNGHFHEKVQQLVTEDGELSRRLREHIHGDNSLLAQQLAKTVGDSSPLMKYLSPEQKDGLIEKIADIAEQKLKAQSDRVLTEFDLNNDDSALNRLIRDVKKINSEIGEKFDPEDEKSVLSRLNKALEETRSQIQKDLTLDDETSSLSRLHGGLRKQLEELAAKQIEFQNAVSEQLGIKQVQARTTEGGFSFEHLAAEQLKTRIIALGDEFQSVGELHGVLKRKTGDHLQTLGSESAVPGASIVYECKRDKTYRIKVALDELKEARKNRAADVGVFIMSAETLRNDDSLRGEYPAALARYDNDILVVWDCEDASTDVALDAAISLARALVVRSAKAGDGDEAREFQELNESIADIEKQFERFEKMRKWCDSIMASAKDVGSKADDIQDELRKVLKRLKSDVKALNEGLEALQEERED
jgi:hypothetical protein